MSSPPIQRRTQIQRRADAEAAILDATTQLIVDGGLANVTLAAVGERAGYSRGIVTHHFGTRQTLLDTLARRLQDLFQLPDANGASGRDHLMATVDAYLVHMRSERTRARAFLAMWAQSLTGDPDLAPIFTERDARFQRTLTEAIRGGQADASIRTAVDAPALAVVLIGLLRGVAIELVLPKPAVSIARVRAAVAQLVDGHIAA